MSISERSQATLFAKDLTCHPSFFLYIYEAKLKKLKQSLSGNNPQFVAQIVEQVRALKQGLDNTKKIVNGGVGEAQSQISVNADRIAFQLLQADPKFLHAVQ
jgi:hypothetical protein